MKRTKKTVEKRTYALKNAFPRFVSIVTRGANFMPFSELRYSEGNAKFTDVEINKIVFAKESFTSKEAVSAYLKENDFEDYKIEEEATTYFVPGVESDKFEEISTVEFENGVVYSVGKLKEPIEDNQEAAEVVEAIVVASDPVETPEEKVVESEVDGEEVKEPDAEEAPTPEPTSEDPVSVEGTEGTSAQEEVVAEEAPVVEVDKAAALNEIFSELSTKLLALFSDTPATVVTVVEPEPEVVVEEVVAAAEPTEVEVLKAKIEELEAKIEEFSQQEEKVVDEEQVIIQNRQSIQNEEVTDEPSVKTKDPETEKFEQKKFKNLLGLN